MHQKTIAKEVKATGIGLHSGKKVKLKLKPAPENYGIKFVRTDIYPNAIIDVDANNITETTLCTTVSSNGIKVATIEHLYSALAGLRIDNLIIEIDAPEIPIMDGSASPFVYLILSAGIVQQDAYRKYLLINDDVSVQVEDKWAKLTPYNGFKVDLKIDFEHPEIIRSGQSLSLDLANENEYVLNICKARTFGFINDIEYLQKKDLIQGGSLDNAIVLDEFKMLNKNNLRYENEFVRHKILDAVGDLYISGHQIIGKFTAYKTGHALNNILIRKLLKQKEKWSIIEIIKENTTQKQGKIITKQELIGSEWSLARI